MSLFGNILKGLPSLGGDDIFGIVMVATLS